MTQEILEKIEIEIKKLQEIANYYEFPFAVFFIPIGELKGTRKDNILIKIKEFRKKINELVGEL